MNQAPRSRRAFRGVADELDYLNEKISYWWHQRGERRHAIQFVDRFEELLQSLRTDDGSIVMQEYWGLLHEVRGSLKKAIAARKREAALIGKLLDIAGPVGPVDHEYLLATLLLIASLHLQADETSQSIDVLHEAEQLANTHSLSFRGRGLLESLLKHAAGAGARQPA